MPSYRCYLLDSRGIVFATEDFDCGGEEGALILARQLCAERDAAGLELWQRPRLVYMEKTGPSRSILSRA